MRDKEIPPFYVGQEIIALVTNAAGCYKKGDEFTVTSIKIYCHSFGVTIGVRGAGSICDQCNSKNVSGNGEVPFSCVDFAPKYKATEFISMKQLAEQQLETIGAN